jgi:uncharacterized protein (DUF488 family)
MSDATIYTVGHSNAGTAEFVALLARHEVTAIADVRSHPYSRFLPHFSQPALKAALREAGVRYAFLGRELGARPDDPRCYVDGTAVYARIAATPLFAKGLQRLREGARAERIALLCAERDPLVCHRAILVCRHLRAPGLALRHILADGGIEEHAALEERLLRAHGLDQLSLFDPQPLAARIEAAYDRQGAQIAYTRDGGDDDGERA